MLSNKLWLMDSASFLPLGSLTSRRLPEKLLWCAAPGNAPPAGSAVSAIFSVPSGFPFPSLGGVNLQAAAHSAGPGELFPDATACRLAHPSRFFGVFEQPNQLPPQGGGVEGEDDEAGYPVFHHFGQTGDRRAHRGRPARHPFQ